MDRAAAPDVRALDLARIDHFRGFAAFWAIPEGRDELDARTGRWLPGPGEALFRAAEGELGELPVIAEDLGLITPDVGELRDALGFPGMAVMLWAFQGPATTRTGSRTTASTRSSTRRRTTRTRSRVLPEPRAVAADRARALLRAALAMVPVQDVLGLGSEARMNTPGEPTATGRWRLEPGQLTDELAGRLARGDTRPPAGCRSATANRRGGAHGDRRAAAARRRRRRVVLAVGPGDAEHHRHPAPEAEPALLLELAREDERPPSTRKSAPSSCGTPLT